ncbi:hypothetical protein MPEAHAMD_1613 [Methylobacterium frigidaeris]|uniref:Uncharacterized protein n=1 Tax=Methylobacterium frigidaeris TaxID=2038277 RepID=A0AA37H9Y3_9HYPH|nr:hypothetical protein MPEAHAMD_1613 [Methylobacterium frigidaeris]
MLRLRPPAKVAASFISGAAATAAAVTSRGSIDAPSRARSGSAAFWS